MGQEKSSGLAAGVDKATDVRFGCLQVRLNEVGQAVECCTVGLQGVYFLHTWFGQQNDWQNDLSNADLFFSVRNSITTFCPNKLVYNAEGTNTIASLQRKVSPTFT